MARNKKEEEAPQGLAPWMATYSDLVTLLLCFFVMLYASSSPDVAKLQAISNSISRNPNSIIDVGSTDGIMEWMGNGIIEMPVGSDGKTDKQKEYDQENIPENVREAINELNEMTSTFRTYFAEQNLTESIQIMADEQSIRLNFGDMLFDSGKADLKPMAIEVLDMIAVELVKYSENDIYIAGHTDNIPINTAQFKSNRYLSSARAISVAEYFESAGIDPRRVSTQGYGEYWPIDTNETPEGRTKNRRVEIKIVSKVYSNQE